MIPRAAILLCLVLWLVVAVCWVVTLARVAPRCEPSSPSITIGHMLIGGCE